MIFPYRFDDLVIQLGRYNTLASGYIRTVEKALESIGSNDTVQVERIRTKAQEHNDAFLRVNELLCCIAETHRPKETQFPQKAYLFGKKIPNDYRTFDGFYFLDEFLPDKRKPSFFPDGFGVVEKHNLHRVACRSCGTLVPIIYEVSTSESPKEYAICLHCEDVRIVKK
jgi:hypothetical protein